MGLEYHNANVYYYEKRRVGGRVVSEYVGGGPFALLAEQYAQERAEEEAARQQAFEQERTRVAALCTQVDLAVDQLMRMAEAELIAAGYHTHKRQWRKRRNEQSNKDQG